MTTEQVIINRIQELPNYLHLQVIDYLEYLISKHNTESDADINNDDLSEGHRKILMQRYEKYKENPHVGEDWEIVKKRLTERYAV